VTFCRFRTSVMAWLSQLVLPRCQIGHGHDSATPLRTNKDTYQHCCCCCLANKHLLKSRCGINKGSEKSGDFVANECCYIQCSYEYTVVFQPSVHTCDHLIFLTTLQNHHKSISSLSSNYHHVEIFPRRVGRQEWEQLVAGCGIERLRPLIPPSPPAQDHRRSP